MKHLTSRDKAILFYIALIPVALGIYFVPQMFIDTPTMDLFWLVRIVITSTMLISIAYVLGKLFEEEE